MTYLSLSIPGTGGNSVPISPPPGIPAGSTITLSKVISLGVQYLIIAAIGLALFFLIWSGFDWMSSSGDKEKLAKAQQKLIFSIIGLIVVFLAFLIINLITYFFGVGSLSG